MNKTFLLGLPLVLIAPLLLLVLGLGNATITTVQASCTNTTFSSTASGTVGIGTLNWRGASHYQRNPHTGERPYTARVPNMVAKIGAAAVTIVGFQEFEAPQAQAFLDATAGHWAIVPGRAHGAPDTRDAIAYQPSAWTVAGTRYVTINYGGTPVQIPLVRFTATPSDRTDTTSLLGAASATASEGAGSPSAGNGAGNGAGSGSIWVLNTHNTADVVNGTDAMRDDAVRAEAEALLQLRTTDPTTPLFLTGDMNDRARFRTLFLTLTGTGWSTGNPTDAQIDWIMGSPGVTFSNTVVDTTTNDNAHNYTDHPFVHTTAQLADPPSGPEAPAQPTTATTATVEPVPGGAPSALGTTRSKTASADPPLAPPNHASPSTSDNGQTASKNVSATPMPTGAPTGPPAATCTPCPTTSTKSARPAEPTTSPGTERSDAEMHAALAGSAATGSPGTRSATTAPATTAETPTAETTTNGTIAAPASSDPASTAPTRPESPTEPTSATVRSSCTSWPLAVAGQLTAELTARVDAMLHTPDGLCALSWTHGAPCTFDNQCPKVIDALYGGPGVGRGYGNGQDVAQGIINAGLARAHGTGLNPLPPVGAVVSYNAGNGAGHVALYVGNATIFGNDYGCTAHGVYGCVGFADVHAPGGTITWALPTQAFDLGGMPRGAA